MNNILTKEDIVRVAQNAINDNMMVYVKTTPGLITTRILYLLAYVCKAKAGKGSISKIYVPTDMVVELYNKNAQNGFPIDDGPIGQRIIGCDYLSGGHLSLIAQEFNKQGGTTVDPYTTFIIAVSKEDQTLLGVV